MGTEWGLNGQHRGILNEMNERVKRLRKQSLEAVNRISAERGLLVTAFYRELSPMQYSVPVQRARLFEYILKNKAVCINEGELIVGERGPAPKATPTYPEINLHTLKDLETLDGREKVSFRVDRETREAFREVIIPYWEGKTNRDRIFRNMSDAWKEAYAAGIFTEFQEQRAPGHTVLGDKIYRMGMREMAGEVRKSMEALDFHGDPQAYEKLEELRAMEICAGALVMFAERHAEALEALGAGEADRGRKEELKRMAAVCRSVPARAPSTLHEALQYYWFVHLGVITELNPWDSFNPGRLDQHLLPFYRNDLETGVLDEAGARELLQCFWIKFNNQPAPPKVGVTAEESGTYTDFAQINCGGVTPDGGDGVNAVTYLILDVIEEMRLLQPSSSVQVSKKNPDAFIRRAGKIIRTGFGQPSIFNTDLVIAEMLRQGKRLADARCGGTSGCVETGAFGKENYNLTGYFNMPKVLELALHNGIDPRTGKQLGPQTGDPRSFAAFDDLFAAFERQLLYFIDVKVRGNAVIERLYARSMPVPFLSLLIDDCIARGRDYHDGGARYNTSYIQGVGLGTMADALSAIKFHVYDQKTLTMEALLEALEADFGGHERIQQLLLNRTPRYGNDDDYADALMMRVVEA